MPIRRWRRYSLPRVSNIHETNMRPAQRGDIIQAGADYLWRGDRVMWRKGQTAEVKSTYTFTMVILPEGRKRNMEIERSHPHHIIKKDNE